VGRIVKRRVAAFALTLGLVAGGAIAAVAATGGSGSGAAHSAAGARHGAHFLATAADYLGISRGQLQTKLRSGQSLAQIASASGKPVAPLMQTLGQAASTQVQHRLSSHQASAKHANRHGRHSLRAAAGHYLGITATALGQQLRSGASLAQIADRTPGRSAAGLVDALVAARLQNAPPAGAKHGKAPSAAQLAKLRKRITALVNKTHSAKQKTPPA
jgi:hypothetical protein